MGPGGDAQGQPLFARRASTEAIHEVGHAYGLAHGKVPECVMWFSTTLAETDRKGTEFCSTHAAALKRALGGRAGLATRSGAQPPPRRTTHVRRWPGRT